jgi:hypothetical protein
MKTVTLTIRAAADTIGGPEDWASLCVTAAEGAHAAVLENPPPSDRTPLTGAEQLFRDLCLGNGQIDPFPDAGEQLTGEPLLAAARAAASVAFRCCMPQLVNRRAVQCFIACTATGLLRGYLDGRTANALLYAAQASLTANPKRARARRK